MSDDEPQDLPPPSSDPAHAEPTDDHVNPGDPGPPVPRPEVRPNDPTEDPRLPEEVRKTVRRP